jgi:heme/copper-type cytochrome/quinol oxidase subunit 2
MSKENRLKFWTILIPLMIVAVLAALDIWPGKAMRMFHTTTVKSNRELVGAFGEEDWEWTESGEGYQYDETRMVRHGRWTETHADPFSGTWRAEGEYRKDKRHGRWTVYRDGELFREFVFKAGRPVEVIRPAPEE